MAPRTRKFGGWGVVEEDVTPQELQGLIQHVQARFGLKDLKFQPPPRIEDIQLKPPRVKPPARLSHLCSQEPQERAGHTYGKAFKDVVRAYQRDFAHAPDWVAFPQAESELVELLEWCSSQRIAAIPYGGGSSVVSGVEPDVGPGYAGAVSIDLKHLNRVLEIDRTSRAAHIQGGIYGPDLEAALRQHRLTLRHYPQSFEFSTLGGWIATRGGGHYATLYTHIDDFVENLRVVTPAGISESFRLPGSGAGPSPDRLFIGSEGTLGIITSAWMRLQDRPTFRANASVFFPTFLGAAEAVRAITQAGLYPANVRILDPGEALNNGVADGRQAVMVLGFESADHPLDAWMVRALECCRDHGGTLPAGASTATQREAQDAKASRKGAAGAWRDAFIRMPYWRDALVGLGLLSETFETAITWDRFPSFHQQVMDATTRAVREVCGQGSVTCRFTHAYPDGPAPYYSVQAPGKPGSQLRMMEEIKAAASEAIVRLGGTITHHHAVGRYHRPWYDKQRPAPFAGALRAAKKALDPAGILNPRVLIDP
ncbi:MAG TPA: FAD-binding oxidoreductase [bacterium]|nr:FAD-binding oxidoreductase [bacterium]